MRGAMVRNTRALAGAEPAAPARRHLRAQPSEAEARCYQELTALTRELGADGQAPAVGAAFARGRGVLARRRGRGHRAFRRTPAAATQRWRTLAERYAAIGAGAKQAALLQLLARNPGEKKMVFVHHRDSMTISRSCCAGSGIALARVRRQHDRPGEGRRGRRFRDGVPVLLCSESGGEGRNLQFCNTLINFDIPWNPMAIEQRIGRIDRIGQTREVFVFNLVPRGTIEDAVLRLSTRRSTCSSWWSARSAPSSASSTTSRTSPHWSWTPG